MNVSQSIALHEIRILSLDRTSWSDKTWNDVSQIIAENIPSVAIRWLVDVVEGSVGDFDATQSERIEVLRWLPPSSLAGELASTLTMPWTAAGAYIRSLLMMVSDTYEGLAYRDGDGGALPRFELRVPHSKPWPLDDLVSVEDTEGSFRRIQIYLSFTDVSGLATAPA